MDEKSKSARKRDVETLQKMAVAIGKLTDNQISKLNLPDNLLKAIQEYKKIKSNSALRRQAQYMGRLMRDIDPEEIKKIAGSLPF